MRLMEMMEENRDTAGWGLLGTIMGLFMYSSWIEQAGMAALVAASGLLGSYVTKKLVNYIESKVTSWWKNRKTKTNNQ